MMSAEEQLFEQLRRAREQNELEDYRADDIISSVKQQVKLKPPFIPLPFKRHWGEAAACYAKQNEI